MSNILLTGDRPTGKLHLGHFVGSLQNRIHMQNSNCFNEMYIMIADLQALTDNADNPQKIRQSIPELMLDYLSVGISPDKFNFFLQSEVQALSELTVFFLNLVSVSRLERNPTVKNEIKEKNFEKSIPAGFLTYPVSQAADIAAFKATHIPGGEDQKPMIEQTNEIVKKFNSTYNTQLLKKCELILPKKGHGRLIGIDGKSKMSKSLENTIYLSDSEKVVKEKIMNMYTDPNHIQITDPGKIEGNTVFTYLDVFSPDSDKVDKLKEQYQNGGLGDVKLKLYLNDVLQDFLSPIRVERERFSKDLDEVIKILKHGTDYANNIAEKTLSEVKKDMNIDFFRER